MSGLDSYMQRLNLNQPSAADRERKSKLREFATKISENLPKAFHSDLVVQNWIANLIQNLLNNADYSTSLDKIKESYSAEKERLDPAERAYILETILPKFEEDYGIKIDLE